MTQNRQDLIDIIRFEIFGGDRPHIGVNSELYATARHHEVAQLVADFLGCTGKKVAKKSDAATADDKTSQQSDIPDLKAMDPELVAKKEAEEKFRAEIGELYNAELYRALTFKTDLSRISMILDEAGIDFIPLKGAIIRDMYPKNWMRSSTDIDILVRPEDLDKAIEAITSQPGYMLVNETNHHTLIESKTGWIIEVHFTLNPDDDAAKTLLDKAWEYAEPAGATVERAAASHRYNFTDEFFEFYFYYHLSHHALKQGALGLRQMLDVFMITGQTKDATVSAQEGAKTPAQEGAKTPAQEGAKAAAQEGAKTATQEGAKTNKLLAKAGLDKFAHTARIISQVWFGDLSRRKAAKMLGITVEELEEIEDFAFEGGLAGSPESKITMRKMRDEEASDTSGEGSSANSQAKGGKSYTKGRIVLSSDDLASMHKEVRDNPRLAPFYQVKRWGRLLKPGRAKKAKKEIELASSIGDNEVDRAKRIIKNLGL